MFLSDQVPNRSYRSPTVFSIQEKSPLRREIQCVCCSPRRVVSATLPPTPSYGEREDYGEKEEEN